LYSENNTYPNNNSASNNASDYTCATGSSETFRLLNDDSDVKVDILAQKHYGATIWGQIKDEYEKPIAEAFVKLIKPVYCNGKIEYISIAKCMSDCNGFYQFNVESTNDDSAYKVIVSKTVATTVSNKSYKNEHQNMQIPNIYDNIDINTHSSYSREDITNKSNIQF
jgi:hypothetical protein